MEQQKVGMLAGGAEGEHGELRRMVDEHVGKGVCDHVIDGVERLAADVGDGAGGQRADEQAADEAGAGGNGDAVDGVPRGAGALEGLIDDGQDDFDVAASGDLGYDATIGLVDVDLAGDDVGAHVPAVFDHGGGGFIAGGFDAENKHVSDCNAVIGKPEYLELFRCYNNARYEPDSYLFSKC